MTTLKRIIPLQNLTTLNITFHEYSFDKLIELLSFTQNIVTLKIRRIYPDEIDFIAIQNSETFQLVSNVNIIRNLIVTEINEVKEVQFLFNLCTRIQHFKII